MQTDLVRSSRHGKDGKQGVRATKGKPTEACHGVCAVLVHLAEHHAAGLAANGEGDLSLRGRNALHDGEIFLADLAVLHLP